MFSYNLVRWPRATRWMALRAGWSGCSVGMLVTSAGVNIPGTCYSRVEGACDYIDACVDVYVLVGIVVSCRGA